MNLKKKLLIPFFTAGFPELQSTRPILEAFAGAGADYLEIGLPHSDALADGPVIQESSHQALTNGMNIELLFSQVEGVKGRLNRSKLVLFSYFNPLLAYGLEKTLKGWRAAGGHSLLVPDLPVEESEELLQICRENNISLIFLIAPTSTPERIERIAKLSQEFIYLVSVTGVTGIRRGINDNLNEVIRRIKRVNPQVPVVIGFGIGNPETAENALSQGADGVVVGSALVKLLKEQGLQSARELVSAIRSSQGFKEH